MILLARVSLGVFFAISGGNKLFVAGCLLVIGLLTSLSCAALTIQMIVAITTVQIAMIPKALSFLNWVDELLYLPEACVYRHLDLVDLLRTWKTQPR